jgi:DnaJ-class molecular chaperone
MLFPDGVASDDIYGLLGLSPAAPRDELEAAWRTEVQRWHPDRNPDPLATSRTAFINVAYGILRDRSQRTRYDAGGLTRSHPPRRDQERKRRSPAEERWRASRERWAAEEERGRRFRNYFQLESQMNAAYARRPRADGQLREALRVALLAVPCFPGLSGTC